MFTKHCERIQKIKETGDLTLFRMSLLGAAHEWGEARKPPP